MGVQMVMSITLGEFVICLTTVATATAAVVAVRWELKSFRRELTDFRTDFTKLSDRVGTHEKTLTQMFGQIQRLIGVIYGRAPDVMKPEPL